MVVLVHALLLYARRFTGRFEISRDGLIRVLFFCCILILIYGEVWWESLEMNVVVLGWCG